jgi:hypothetical protein
MIIYNLADIIRFKLQYGLSFDGSLAKKYLENCPHDVSIDFDLLRKIVCEYNIEPEKDAMCVHVRLGDILGFDQYKNNMPDIYSIIKHHELHKKYHKCKLFYGNHNNKFVKESQEILENLCEKLEEIGLNVAIESNEVDEDFIKLSTAQCYVAGQRGFGWLAASINPNQVYWDMQNPPYFDWLLNRKFLGSMISGYEYHRKIKQYGL